MKKVLLFILVFTILSVNTVNAKEGFYAGGSVAINIAKYDFDPDAWAQLYFKNTKPTIAINLGYKFNFNSFSVAPELYFNILNKVIDTDDNYTLMPEQKVTAEAKELGGLNIKLGYDVINELNIFLLAGISYIKDVTIDGETRISRNAKFEIKQPV